MPRFTPVDPAFEARVRRSFARQAVMATFGAALTAVAPGQVEITLPCRQELTQQHGFQHAGVLATILDSACGYAAFTLMPEHAAVLSVEFKLNLLAPAAGDSVVARARVIRAGKNLTVCQGDAFAVAAGEEKHVATMVGTMMCVLDRAEMKG